MSPRPANPQIRQSIIESAMAQFFERGFEAVSLAEICQTAGVTKGALFHHFPAKEDLGLAVLDAWLKQGLQLYADRLKNLNQGDSRSRALFYIDITIELTEQAPPGCLIGLFALELGMRSDSFRAATGQAFQRWAQQFEELLEACAPEGFKKKYSVDAGSLARHFVAVFEGAQVLARSQASAGVAALHLKHYRNYLECIFSGAMIPAKQK